MVVSFTNLKVGDRFIYDGQLFQRIETINVGCCSPQWNAQCVNEPELLGYFHSGHKVEKVDNDTTDKAEVGTSS